jgi:hypothetical protein
MNIIQALFIALRAVGARSLSAFHTDNARTDHRGFSGGLANCQRSRGDQFD